MREDCSAEHSSRRSIAVDFDDRFGECLRQIVADSIRVASFPRGVCVVVEIILSVDPNV